ncbi:hypothetical protein NR800_27315 [Corallococcus interemptor]|uniref:GNAT family N-acetyltransferase n=1 Tax=Corallococcus TaxID=83461 RepID=UPI001CBCB269|nr:hypothetical protein [Corallococcus sp. AS-1-6]MBZ4375123.1 hypothetical protein [Corallococcus sp. AS-1-6]
MSPPPTLRAATREDRASIAAIYNAASPSAPPPSEAEGAGFHKLTSRVFATNVLSRALLKRLGFREVGVHEKHAPLDGVWHDVVVVEKLLLANVR